VSGVSSGETPEAVIRRIFTPPHYAASSSSSSTMFRCERCRKPSERWNEPCEVNDEGLAALAVLVAARDTAERRVEELLGGSGLVAAPVVEGQET
jgi:hypothetical protein